MCQWPVAEIELAIGLLGHLEHGTIVTQNVGVIVEAYRAFVDPVLSQLRYASILMCSF